MNLPVFKYHPNPVASGVIEESDTKCVCCGQVRGYIYTGPVYAIEDYHDRICPWCIADGSAHAKLDASFTDEAGIGGYGSLMPVPPAVIEEVAYRTPGFIGWQQEQWWAHCGDAGQYLGRAGKEELAAAGPEAIRSVRESCDYDDGPEWDAVFSAFDKNGSPTAYLFRCTKCGQVGGYWDCD